MNLDSPLFDRIRTNKAREAAEEPRAAPACDHPGCRRGAAHRAPKGRGREGEFWRFCLDHARAYNQSYNYFAGMDDEALRRFQKDALHGHRPTWAMGVNARAAPGDAGGPQDPFGLFRDAAARRAPPEPARRHLGPLARRALEALGLDETADAAAVKARYKLLVKRLHPDANGGDRAYEDRLRAIIDAYNTLKGAGLA